MKRSERINSHLFGVTTGLVIPVVIYLLFWLWKGDGMGVVRFFNELIRREVLSNVISVSVFFNVTAFLLFNHLDALKSSRGILGITIAWAILVFIIKLS